MQMKIVLQVFPGWSRLCNVFQSGAYYVNSKAYIWQRLYSGSVPTVSSRKCRYKL